MKKISIVMILLSLIFCSCENKMKKTEINEEQTTEIETQEDKYVDDSNITLGFYLHNNGVFHYIDNEIYLDWNQYVDIEVFSVLATNEQEISGYYMQDIFPKYWNQYENIDKYKLGYNLTYKTSEGEFSYNIINPSDRMLPVFGYVQIYEYDDVTPSKNTWYDHLDDEEITPGVLATSIKLCASTYIDDVIGPMELTVFAYDSDDDFDPITKKYRGNSYKKIYIYKNN